MDDEETVAIRQRIAELRIEHRDLDEAIVQLSQNTNYDQLALRRMKKRKLLLKDSMAKLESMLVPDLNA